MFYHPNQNCFEIIKWGVVVAMRTGARGVNQTVPENADVWSHQSKVIFFLGVFLNH